MSNEQVNKVDLSLDEIIKLNKKQRQQRSRGGSSMSQGKAGGRGQGVGGRRNSRGRRGGSGISPLKRKQTGTGSNVGGSRGQSAGRRGQRGNLRGWAGNRGGLRRGGSIGSRGGSRGGSSASSISSSLNTNTRGSRGRGNQRENLDPALEVANHAGFDPADIASKLSKVLDTFRLRQLRSESRNLTARKVVLDRRYSRERLLCESDDLVVIYDCKRQVMIDWFIRKDRKRRLTHFEEDALNCVMMWSPVCSEKYKATCDMLSRKVAILASAIRHLYGLLAVIYEQ